MIVWPVSRFGLLDSPDIQGTEAAAASGVGASRCRVGAAWPIGLAGAVPIVALAPASGASRARLTHPSFCALTCAFRTQHRAAAPFRLLLVGLR